MPAFIGNALQKHPVSSQKIWNSKYSNTPAETKLQTSEVGDETFHNRGRCPRGRRSLFELVSWGKRRSSKRLEAGRPNANDSENGTKLISERWKRTINYSRNFQCRPNGKSIAGFLSKLHVLFHPPPPSMPPIDTSPTPAEEPPSVSHKAKSIKISRVKPLL
jgi:hypothetical protein